MVIEVCRVCKSTQITQFFDLGLQPLANSLLESAAQNESVYPLSLSWCGDCNLIQLDYTADPKELFSNYVWVTGTSKVANEYAERFYQELAMRSPKAKDGYTLEIASNDGTFLLPFLRNGYSVLGVDPAQNIAEMAEKGGVPTKCAFWGKEAAEQVIKERGLAHSVFARNVLPHVANTHDFVDGLAASLHEEGTLAIEVHYAKIILEELHYDSIYHEHLCFFTFKSLERLLNDHGLFVFDVIGSPISGGSIVVYAKKKKTAEAPTVQQYRDQEIKDKINELSSWQNFAAQSFSHRDKLKEILSTALARKKNIIGWGASARSSTLLNFCGVTSELLPLIVDLNPLKQGKYTAGTHILITGSEAVRERKPEMILILGWNFADEIMRTLKTEFDYRGDCIIPLPGNPRIQMA